MPERSARVARLVAVLACLAVAAAGVRGWGLRAKQPVTAGGDSAPVGGAAWLVVAVLVALVTLAAMVYAGRILANMLRRRPKRISPWRSGRWWITAAMVTLLGAFLLAIVIASRTRSVETAPTVAPTATASPTRPESLPLDTTTLLVLAVAAGVAITAAYAATAWSRRLAARGGESRARADEPTAQDLAAALDAAAQALAMATMDAQAPPREAVIRCYAAMERSLRATRAAPLASDTPTDVLRRAGAAGVLRGPGAAVLTGLFEEARYSSHPFTPEHLAQAAQALEAVRVELSAALPGAALPGVRSTS